MKFDFHLPTSSSVEDRCCESPRYFNTSGFYTKLNVWGSLGLNFDYNGGHIIENGGPIFLYMDLP